MLPEVLTARFHNLRSKIPFFRNNNGATEANGKPVTRNGKAHVVTKTIREAAGKIKKRRSLKLGSAAATAPIRRRNHFGTFSPRKPLQYRGASA